MYYTFFDYIKNKYFEELSVVSPPIRSAIIFKRTCEEIPLFIADTDVIAGRYGTDDAKSYEIVENKNFPIINDYSAEELNVLQALSKKFCISFSFDRGHLCIDYGSIIKNGLKSYEQEIQQELSKADISKEKDITLQAMLVALDGVKIYVRRFSELVAGRYATSGELRFLKMQTALSKVPYEPCESFYEAITAIWILHCLVPISDNCWSSISLGRVDQYLYPFYKKSLADGVSREEMKAVLKNLFELLNCYGDGACALNVSGVDENGKDMTNDLSRLFLEVEKEYKGTSPIFVVRINPNTPNEFLDECIDLSLFSIGQPTFYGEIPCRNALIERGVPEREAINFTVNSCMGLYMSGQEIASMWGCKFNMHLPLEFAVNQGRGLQGKCPFDLDVVTKTPENLDELLTLYKTYLEKILLTAFYFCRRNRNICASNLPNPFISALTRGCVENGLDRAIGAKYNTETIETMALANTANAICAIDTLVFKEKKYTLKQYVSATQESYRNDLELLADIKACEKYGTNSKYANDIAAKLCEMVSEICKKNSEGNDYFIPSLHTLDSNIWFGMDLYTTLDGRLKGEPVAKNAGPTTDVRTTDVTNVFLAAATLPQHSFSGGQPIDVYFAPSVLKTKEKRDKIKALLKTYFSLGGLQVQVNSVDVAMLEKAYDNPEEYSDLIVRIGGYSMRFTWLYKHIQREFIERFKKENG